MYLKDTFLFLRFKVSHSQKYVCMYVWRAPICEHSSLRCFLQVKNSLQSASNLVHLTFSTLEEVLSQNMSDTFSKA